MSLNERPRRKERPREVPCEARAGVGDVAMKSADIPHQPRWQPRERTRDYLLDAEDQARITRSNVRRCPLDGLIPSYVARHLGVPYNYVMRVMRELEHEREAEQGPTPTVRG